MPVNTRFGNKDSRYIRTPYPLKSDALHIDVDRGLENNCAIVLKNRAEILDRKRFSNDREGYDYFHQLIEKHQEQISALEVLMAMVPTNYLWKLFASGSWTKGGCYCFVNAALSRNLEKGILRTGRRMIPGMLSRSLISYAEEMD